jgi:hypothetical protein
VDITIATDRPAADALAAEVDPPRPALVGVLARAHAAEQAALRRVAELEAELRAARTEQITDGADPRLVEFWDRAGRIADHADFCEEYDRLADAMNGVARQREWEVTAQAIITVNVSRVVTARTAEEAESALRDEVGDEVLIDAIRYSAYDLEFENIDAERQ